MKTFILTITILVISISGFCQFYPSPDLDIYVGTWKWGSGNDSVIIVFQKQIVHTPYMSESAEELIGWHKYIKNGQIKESSLQYTGSSYDAGRAANDIKSSLKGYLTHPGSIQFYIKDLTLNKGAEVAWNLLPGNNMQAQWILKDHRGLYIGPQGTYALFTLPRNMIFIKQP